MMPSQRGHGGPEVFWEVRGSDEKGSRAGGEGNIDRNGGGVARHVVIPVCGGRRWGVLTTCDVSYSYSVWSVRVLDVLMVPMCCRYFRNLSI